MIGRRIAVRLALGGVVASAAVIGAAGPAQAVPFVVCDSISPQGPRAPTISGSAGVFTARYFHKCNTIDGVTHMLGVLDIVQDVGNDGNRDNDLFVRDRTVVTVPQGEGEGTLQWPVGANHGQYYAQETLFIEGQFTTGPTPEGGCGRV